MTRVTLAQVAERASVSVSAVSVVLNGHARERRLSDECVERVQAAARELGYQGNYGARALARGKSMTLGFVAKYVPGDPALPRIQSGFEREANEHGYEVLTLCLRGNEGPMRRAVRYVKQGRIDGFAIYVGGWTESPAVRDLPSTTPVAHIWYRPEAFRPVVVLDPAPGIREAVQHVAELGHRRLAWIGIGANGSIELPERLEAFRKACDEVGVETVEHFVEAPERSVRGFHECLANPTRILEDATAALCYNDTMATALSIALRDLGLKVPDDVALVGFDNTFANQTMPALTTISHSFVEMGRAAMRHIYEMVENEDGRSDEIVRVPSRLIVRESTTG